MHTVVLIKVSGIYVMEMAVNLALRLISGMTMPPLDRLRAVLSVPEKHGAIGLIPRGQLLQECTLHMMKADGQSAVLFARSGIGLLPAYTGQTVKLSLSGIE